MGACSFKNYGRGRSAQDVFRKLQENAEREYGDDSYNGTISTVPGFHDVTDDWKKARKILIALLRRK